MKIKLSENEATKQVIDYLELKKYRVYKIYNGAVAQGVANNRIIYRKKEEKMLIYEELLDLANRIKQVVENNPGKIAEINMGLVSQLNMERLENWVNRIKRELKK